MKKILKISFLFSFSMLLQIFTSCSFAGKYTSDDYYFSEEPKLEWDGQYLYHYVEKEDYYVIVGEEEGLGGFSESHPNEVIFPAYYNNKLVKYVQYNFIMNNRLNSYNYKMIGGGINYTKAERVYSSFLCTVSDNESFVKEIYSVSCYKISRSKAKEHTIFYTKFMYDNYIKDKKLYSLYLWEEQNEYTFIEFEINYKRTVKIANTAYMFNYEDSPNENYFFINNFERGGKIENTPYEPIRDGYTFTGWYKDEGCTQKWNFETDTLPKWEYDEGGNEIFVETKLFAGWSKNN